MYTDDDDDTTKQHSRRKRLNNHLSLAVSLKARTTASLHRLGEDQQNAVAKVLRMAPQKSSSVFFYQYKTALVVMLVESQLALKTRRILKLREFDVGWCSMFEREVSIIPSICLFDAFDTFVEESSV